VSTAAANTSPYTERWARAAARPSCRA
jgi:hypothetical protein